MTEEYDDGLKENKDNGWRFGEQETTMYTISPNDPLSARAEQQFRKEFGRGDLELVIHGTVKAEPTETELRFIAHIEALEGETQIFEQKSAFQVPRDHI